jgi:UDP-2,3-diacylglucosamine pyrophosphatase LpxH
MTKEFYTELAELIQKHKLTLMTGNRDTLVKTTKGLEGQMMFITDGEKVVSLRGGESMVHKSSTTILLNKLRYKE